MFNDENNNNKLVFPYLMIVVHNSLQYLLQITGLVVVHERQDYNSIKIFYFIKLNNNF